MRDVAVPAQQRRSSTVRKLLTCCLAASVGFGLAANATVFDATAQFSAANNPAGAWSYGWQPSVGSGFTLLTHQLIFGGGAYFWDRANTPGTPPIIGKNTTDHPIVIADNPTVPAGVSMFHPGPNNERAVVRWTSPAAGYADIFVHVGGVAIDPDYVSTDIAILKDSVQLAATSSYNNASRYSYYRRVDVSPGSAIDLSQGFGTNGSYFNDSTAFRFTVVVNECIADLTGDGTVDDSDFSAFAPAYNLLECSAPAMPAGCPADINHDGFVDDADFSFFVVAYNALICPE